MTASACSARLGRGQGSALPSAGPCMTCRRRDEMPTVRGDLKLLCPDGREDREVLKLLCPEGPEDRDVLKLLRPTGPGVRHDVKPQQSTAAISSSLHPHSSLSSSHHHTHTSHTTHTHLTTHRMPRGAVSMLCASVHDVMGSSSPAPIP
jgi:hypothetical protein